MLAVGNGAEEWVMMAMITHMVPYFEVTKEQTAMSKGMEAQQWALAGV